MWWLIVIYVSSALWLMLTLALSVARPTALRKKLLEQRFFDSYEHNILRLPYVPVFISLGCLCEAFYVVTMMYADRTYAFQFLESGFPYRLIGSAVMLLISLTATLHPAVDTVCFDWLYAPVLFELTLGLAGSYYIAINALCGIGILWWSFLALNRRTAVKDRVFKHEYIGASLRLLYVPLLSTIYYVDQSYYDVSSVIPAAIYTAVPVVLAVHCLWESPILGPNPSFCNAARQGSSIGMLFACGLTVLLRSNSVPVAETYWPLLAYGAYVFVCLAMFVLLFMRRMIDPASPVMGILGRNGASSVSGDVRVFFDLLSSEKVLDMMMRDPEWFGVFRAFEQTRYVDTVISDLDADEKKFKREWKVLLLHMVCILSSKSQEYAAGFHNAGFPEKILALCAETMDDRFAETYLLLQYSYQGLSSLEQYISVITPPPVHIFADEVKPTPLPEKKRIDDPPTDQTVATAGEEQVALPMYELQENQDDTRTMNVEYGSPAVEGTIVAVYRLVANVFEPLNTDDRSFLMRRFTLPNVSDSYALQLGATLKNGLLTALFDNLAEEGVSLRAKAFLLNTLILLIRDSRCRRLTTMYAFDKIAAFSREICISAKLAPLVFDFLTEVFAEPSPEASKALNIVLPSLVIPKIIHPPLLSKLAVNDTIGKEIAKHLVNLVVEGVQDLEPIVDAVGSLVPGPEITRLVLLFPSSNVRVQVSTGRTVGRLQRIAASLGSTMQVFPKVGMIAFNNEPLLAGRDSRLAALNYSWAASGDILHYELAFWFFRNPDVEQFVRDNITEMLCANARLPSTKENLQKYARVLLTDFLPSKLHRLSALKILMALIDTSLADEIFVASTEQDVSSLKRSMSMNSLNILEKTHGIVTDGDSLEGKLLEGDANYLLLIGGMLDSLVLGGAFVLDYSVDADVSEEEVLHFVHILTAINTIPMTAGAMGQFHTVYLHHVLSVLGSNCHDRRVHSRLVQLIYLLGRNAPYFVQYGKETCVIDYLMSILRTVPTAHILTIDTILVLSEIDSNYLSTFLANDPALFMQLLASDQGLLFRHVARLFECWMQSSELAVFNAFVNSNSARARMAFLCTDEHASRGLLPKTHRFTYCFAHLDEQVKHRFCALLLDNMLAHSHDTAQVDLLFSAYVMFGLANQVVLSREFCMRLVRAMSFLQGESRFVLGLVLYATQANVDVRDRLYDMQFIRFIVRDWQESVISQATLEEAKGIQALRLAKEDPSFPLLLPGVKNNDKFTPELFLSCVNCFGLWRELVNGDKILRVFVGRSLAKTKVFAAYLSKKRNRVAAFETELPRFLRVLDAVWGFDVQLWEYCYAAIQAHNVRTPPVCAVVASVLKASRTENVFRLDKAVQIELATLRVLCTFFDYGKGRDEKFATMLMTARVPHMIVALLHEPSSRLKPKEVIQYRLLSLFCITRNRTVIVGMLEETKLLDLLASILKMDEDQDSDEKFMAVSILNNLLESETGQQVIRKHEVWNHLPSTKRLNDSKPRLAELTSLFARKKGAKFIDSSRDRDENAPELNGGMALDAVAVDSPRSRFPPENPLLEEGLNSSLSRSLPSVQTSLKLPQLVKNFTSALKAKSKIQPVG